MWNRSIVMKGKRGDRGYWMMDINVRLLMHFISVFVSQDMLRSSGCHGNSTSAGVSHDITLFHILQVLQSKAVNLPQVRGQGRLETLPRLNAGIQAWEKCPVFLLTTCHSGKQQPNKVRIDFIQRHFLYSVKGHGLMRSNIFNEAVSRN